MNTSFRMSLLLLGVTLAALLGPATACGSGDEGEDYWQDEQALQQQMDRDELRSYLMGVKQYQKQVRATMRQLQAALRRAPERMELPYREELGAEVVAAADELHSAQWGLEELDVPRCLTSDMSRFDAGKQLLASADDRTAMANRLLDAVAWTGRKSKWELKWVRHSSWDAEHHYTLFWNRLEETCAELGVKIPFAPLPDYTLFGTP